MMITKGGMLAALALVLFFVGVAEAGEANFQPSNMSGAAPAAEEKRNQPAVAQSETAKGEGFWQREWKRSGLKAPKFDRVPNVLGGIGDFFKRQDEEYRARNPKP